MNKSLVKIVLLTLLLTNIQAVTALTDNSGVDFQDTTNHWSRLYDRNLRDQCNVKGFLSTTGAPLNLFKPDQQITRAELVKMVLQCKYDPNYSYNYSKSFSDVASDSWAAPFVAEAQRINLVTGYSDGSFQPNKPVTRAEALKIIILSKYTDADLNIVSNLNFKDVLVTSWPAKYINFAVTNKIVQGFSDNTFRPNQSITRGESAKIINLVFGFSVNQATPPASNPQTNNPPATPTDNSPTANSNGSPMIAGCQIFPSNNPWNQDISQLPVDRNSSNYIASIGLDKHVHPDFGSPAEYGIPYVVVDGNSTPKVNVIADYSDESDFGLAPIPANPPIEGTNSSDGDRHVLVLDKANCLLYETWDSHFDGQTWNVGSAAKFDLNSNALRPDGWTSADAAGLPILPGLVRYDEVKAGAINHALRFTISKTQAAYLHPATHKASSATDANLPPMGLRLRLKSNFDISSYTGDSRVVLEALKKYGMIVADNGSDWYISGEANSNWNDDDLNQLKAIPGSAFEVVDTGEALHY